MEVSDAAHAYKMCFLDLFVYILSTNQTPNIRATDAALADQPVTMHEECAPVPFELYYPHDNRSMRAGDLPNMFNVLMHIPLWGEQNKSIFLAKEIMCKCLPFACQQRKVVKRILTECATGALYAEAIRATKLALTGGGVLKGICWHQGESNRTRVPFYSDQLKNLVKDFRSDFGNPKHPFVFSQIGLWNPEYVEFNQMIVKQPERIENTACVKTDGLKNFDPFHFDSASQRILGQRFADLMFELLKK